MAQAFALTAEYEGTVTGEDGDGNEITVEKFRGATITLNDGTTLDVAQMLQEGDGVIVTDDPETAIALSWLDCLKQTAVPDTHPTLLPLQSRRMSDLLDMPEARALDKRPASKAELVTRIQLAQAGEDPNQELVEEDDGTEKRWVPAPPAGENTNAEDQS